jgi:hypothetical protein
MRIRSGCMFKVVTSVVDTYFEVCGAFKTRQEAIITRMIVCGEMVSTFSNRSWKAGSQYCNSCSSVA